MPAALTSHSSSGAATMAAPTPAVLSTSSTHQPTGTARTKRSAGRRPWLAARAVDSVVLGPGLKLMEAASSSKAVRSEEHTSELQSHSDLVCRLLLEKKKKKEKARYT